MVILFLFPVPFVPFTDVTMKILFSRYQYLLLRLSDMCFALGSLKDPTEAICHHLGIRGRPVHPSRRYISTPEMKRLVEFMEHLVNHPMKLAHIIRPRSVSRIVNTCLVSWS